jgi:hypothetical protein
MSRMLALLVVLVALPLGACSAQTDPAAPQDGPSTKATRAAPYRLDRVVALEAVRAKPPRGFDLALTCRGRAEERCREPDLAKVRWFVATVATGAPLPDGNGMRERLVTIMTAWSTAEVARRYASRRTAELRRYRGEYDIALRRTGPRTYTPGDRGRGELHQISPGRWRGTVLRRVFHHVFHGLVPSRSLLGGHFVSRRGRYVADLEWVARDQVTDRRLSHLPRRLLRRLG